MPCEVNVAFVRENVTRAACEVQSSPLDDHRSTIVRYIFNHQSEIINHNFFSFFVGFSFPVF